MMPSIRSLYVQPIYSDEGDQCHESLISLQAPGLGAAIIPVHRVAASADLDDGGGQSARLDDTKTNMFGLCSVYKNIKKHKKTRTPT